MASGAGVIEESVEQSPEAVRRRFHVPADVIWWIIAFALGTLHIRLFRFSITDIDGMSYLDMGDAYLRGDWKTAINGYWSPLYGIIQALALKIIHPGTYWEYPCTQIVNVLMYILSIAAFEFMLRQLDAFRRARVGAESE